MNLGEVKNALSTLSRVGFRLPDGTCVPEHFHVTEVGLCRKHFIDCGGTERQETVVNFQLWQAGDHDHRLGPQKLLRILEISRKVTGEADHLDVEVEYQQSTIGKYGLDFDGADFQLTTKQTGCLASEVCGVPARAEPQGVGCSPNSGCC